MADISLFKKDFKYFKRKCPPPSHDAVIDFSNIDKDCPPSEIEVLTPRECQLCGTMETFMASLMKAPSDWAMFEIKEKPGLLFIRNPFTVVGQRYWVCRCLKDFTRKPHILNIDGHTDAKLSEDWWTACQREDKESKILKKQLRWATMGYHHDWNTKVYSDTSMDPFPPDLAVLSRYVAKVVGFKNEFNAEAAIVNFYHFDSTLSGHTDHSEIDTTAPLFSFSFGQTAIFLLGGLVPDEKPVPLFIRSGDIVIMSGYSRQCYHGIPKILPATSLPWDDEIPLSEETKSSYSFHSLSQDYIPCSSEHENLENTSGGGAYSEENSKRNFEEDESSYSNSISMRTLKDEMFWKPFRTYITQSRINMNVRQVLPKGCSTLNNKH